MTSTRGRRLLATLLTAQLLLVGCGDDGGEEPSDEGSDTTAAGGDDSAEGPDTTGEGGDGSEGAGDLPVNGAEGELTTTGALEGTWTPGEDLAVECSIPPSVTVKMVDEEIFGALSVDEDGTVKFTSGEVAGVMMGTGGSLEVEVGSDISGEMTLDEVELTADGVTMTISGSIAYGCDYG